MYRMWLKINDNGKIAQSLYTSAPIEPEGYNFVVDDKDLIIKLRASIRDWHLEDGQLHHIEIIEFELVPSKEGKLLAGGVDNVVVRVKPCPFDEVKVKIGPNTVDLPTDDEIVLDSEVPTMVSIEADELKYRTHKPVYVEFI